MKYETPKVEAVLAKGKQDIVGVKCFSIDRMCGHGDTGGCTKSSKIEETKPVNKPVKISA